jgi:hypothetical protein
LPTAIFAIAIGKIKEPGRINGSELATKPSSSRADPLRVSSLTVGEIKYRIKAEGAVAEEEVAAGNRSQICPYL